MFLKNPARRFEFQNSSAPDADENAVFGRCHRIDPRLVHDAVVLVINGPFTGAQVKRAQSRGRRHPEDVIDNGHAIDDVVRQSAGGLQIAGDTPGIVTV